MKPKSMVRTTIMKPRADGSIEIRIQLHNSLVNVLGDPRTVEPAIYCHTDGKTVMAALKPVTVAKRYKAYHLRPLVQFHENWCEMTATLRPGIHDDWLRLLPGQHGMEEADYTVVDGSVLVVELGESRSTGPVENDAQRGAGGPALPFSAERTQEGAPAQDANTAQNTTVLADALGEIVNHGVRQARALESIATSLKKLADFVIQNEVTVHIPDFGIRLHEDFQNLATCVLNQKGS